MRTILKVFRGGRRTRTVIAALTVTVLSSAAVGSAANAGGAGVTRWGGEPIGVYVGGNNDALDDDTVFMGAISLPAGWYHLSGTVGAENWTEFDRDVACTVFARADGDSYDTAIDGADGRLPALSDWDRTIGTPFHTFGGGFSSIFKLNAPGRVWAECTGSDTGQPPWDGVEEKTRPDYPEISLTFRATRISTP
jgi:hypothetical protein